MMLGLLGFSIHALAEPFADHFHTWFYLGLAASAVIVYNNWQTVPAGLTGRVSQGLLSSGGK